MNNIAQNLEPLKNKLRNHSLYSSIKDVDDLKIFTNAHVYAVWDFMSLLKFLQIIFFNFVSNFWMYIFTYNI